MTTYIGDLMYPAEKYIRDGEEKTRWMRCGAAFKTDDGQLSVKITAMPTVMDAGCWFRVFEKREEARPPTPAPNQAAQSRADDDPPF